LQTIEETHSNGVDIAGVSLFSHGVFGSDMGKVGSA
jgi:hypothetical protein